jgi:hypothetical protein
MKDPHPKMSESSFLREKAGEIAETALPDPDAHCKREEPTKGSIYM